MPPAKAASHPSPPKGAKEGSILVLTIVLVILMTMIAIGVATNTAGELSVSSNTDNGRRAFIEADSALKISIVLSRILLFPASYGSVNDFLNNTGNLKISNTDDFEDFDMADLSWDIEATNYMNRYWVAGGRNTGSIISSGDEKKPLITFRRVHPSDSSKSRIVATSSLSLEVDLLGISLEAEGYSTDSSGKRIILTVTTDGRVPVGTNETTSEEGSFYDGTADTTHAILTMAFQEVQ